MDRKKFIATCGFACVAGMSAVTLLLEGCAGSKMTTGVLDGDGLVVPLTAFIHVKKDVNELRKYIIVNHEKLQYPVCVYRHTDTSFTALMMKCTHQGNELTVYGDKLHCAAHGSEFDKQGKVTHGPAESSLREFPVTITNNQIKISLKAS